MKWALAALLWACMATGWVSPAHAQAQVNVGAFIRKDKFEDIKLSPNGDYYAATVPLEDRTVLVVMSRADNKVTGTFALDKNTHVHSFAWVNNERVLIAIAEKFGLLDKPLPTGELYAVNANGGQATILVGYRINTQQVGTSIPQKQSERVWAGLVDTLPDDDKNVVVAIRPWGENTYTRADLLDVYTGRRRPVARAPVPNASFVTDNKGVVRFAHGSSADNASKLFYREGDGKEWRLINDENLSGLIEWPLGFSTDQSVAYLQVQNKAGPDSIVSWDMQGGERKELLRNDNVDPDAIIRSLGRDKVPVGALFTNGKPETRFFSADSPETRLYRSMEAAFPGESVFVTSNTEDGRLALVQTWSDRNPGDFYLYDIQAKKVGYLLSKRDWLDPEAAGTATPIRIPARDGLVLHGYLTQPKESSGKNVPLIVFPHGGPYSVRDRWGFDPDVQMMAAAGYAVLQVNFRGSEGYGRAFEQAGAQQWGNKMQDDLTDATLWAVRQGIAAKDRICIYGASYGAYAALVGVAKEPSLYRCAAGYVGVYDLPMMQRGDARANRRLGRWSKEWVGEGDMLATASPVNMAQQIKVPVFLAAGGEDEIAPIAHTELMERRLAAAGVPVESLYYKTEGHGFYTEEHQREYYTRLLAFFHRHLGGATAK